MLEHRPNKRLIGLLKKNDLISNVKNTNFERLKGGVSSDIWKVKEGDRIFCVKQALPKLKVEAPWHVPIIRNNFESEWLKVANTLLPGSAPKIIFKDHKEMFFAMEYLHPTAYLLWKTELRRKRCKVSDGASVADKLSHLHALCAGDQEVFKRFPRNSIFHAIRLEPYLESVAKKYPNLKTKLFRISRETAKKRITMIHGDVSPKNIMIGPQGPVFIDAECACIGDPAFDLAFCLNHLMLKCLWLPSEARQLFSCFREMKLQYFKNVTWEPKEELERRVAILLPALFLARVDGKSPVEYLVSPSDKNKVRCFSTAILQTNNKSIDFIQDSWWKGTNFETSH